MHLCRERGKSHQEEDCILVNQSIAEARKDCVKALGPDGITNKVLKVAIKANTKEYVDMYNACLTEGVFPSR